MLSVHAVRPALRGLLPVVVNVVGMVGLFLLVSGAHIGLCLALTALLARPRRYRAGRDRTRS